MASRLTSIRLGFESVFVIFTSKSVFTSDVVISSLIKLSMRQ